MTESVTSLIQFVAVIVLAVAVLLFDEMLSRSGRETISHFTWNHPLFGLLPIGVLLYGIANLAIHLWFPPPGFVKGS